MIKKIICWVLVILCAASIFYFSDQPAKQSNKTSKSTISTVFQINPKFRKLSDVKKNQRVMTMHTIMRKLAHFSLYALLGALIFIALSNYKLKLKWLWAVLASLLYAISDEFHQTFVLGRSGELRDVGIDTLGAACGIAVTLLLFLLWKKVIRKYIFKKKTEE